MKGHVFVISAPSGAGKTTILSAVIEQMSGVACSVSHTTRLARQKEQDGIDYHFVSVAQFRLMIDHGDFVEWAEVHDNYYGTSLSQINKMISAGNDVILDIDVQGAEILRSAQGFTASYIFIAPPSMAVLESRLRGRNTEDQASLAKRLATGRKELACKDRYEYLIINDTLAEAVVMLKSIIFAQRSRSGRSYGGEPIILEAQP